MGFIDTIKARAKADKKTIVLPESEDRRTYEAAAQILKEDLANLSKMDKKELEEKMNQVSKMLGNKSPEEILKQMNNKNN